MAKFVLKCESTRFWWGFPSYHSKLYPLANSPFYLAETFGEKKQFQHYLISVMYYWWNILSKCQLPHSNILESEFFKDSVGRPWFIDITSFQLPELLKTAIMQSHNCAKYLRICANFGLMNAKPKKGHYF